VSDADARNWRALNRAKWDERVAVHLKPAGYDLAPLRAGRGALNPVEEAEIGEVKGLRVLHLQCHFGADTLCLAQRGATITSVNWPLHNLDLAGSRFSTLDQINTSNVKSLAPRWLFR